MPAANFVDFIHLPAVHVKALDMAMKFYTAKAALKGIFENIGSLAFPGEHGGHCRNRGVGLAQFRHINIQLPRHTRFVCIVQGDNMINTAGKKKIDNFR